MHVYNQLLCRPDTFSHVYWITVSQDTSIKKLQGSIGRCIGLNLFNEDEERHGAVEMRKELMKKQKWVLILDDLWNTIELQMQGSKKDASLFSQLDKKSLSTNEYPTHNQSEAYFGGKGLDFVY